jgi:hypothetical protein
MTTKRVCCFPSTTRTCRCFVADAGAPRAGLIEDAKEVLSFKLFDADAEYP